jgi:hypothetical protein
MVRSAAGLQDIGLRVRNLDARGVVEIGSAMGLLDDGRVAAVRQAISSSGTHAQEVFTYLANGCALAIAMSRTRWSRRWISHDCAGRRRVE